MMQKKLKIILLSLIFYCLNFSAYALSEFCFEGIDCSESNQKASLGLFANIIESRIKISSGNLVNKKPIKQEVLVEDNLAVSVDKIPVEDKMLVEIKPKSIDTTDQIPIKAKISDGLQYDGIKLNSIVALHLTNQPLQAILGQILPNWQINIDEKLEDVQIDAVIQTTRKQAVIDVARALSARAKFYKYTSPKPTLTLLKIQ